MEPTALAVLALGLLLGVRHAFDADHVVAVSTIVSECRNPLRAIWVGVSWGLGHTTTLLLAGVLILVARVSLPPRASLYFEFLVGVVLVFLGAQIFWSFRRHRVHLHPHEHGEQTHWHFHSHAETAEHTHHRRFNFNNLAYFLIAGITPGEHGHSLPGPGRPLFRLKSYIVGSIHGLAGSAALMLLMLSSLKSTWSGISYILLFGLGSIAAMGTITFFISLPFTFSARLPKINRLVQVVTGFLSIALGFFIIYEIGLREGLL